MFEETKEKLETGRNQIQDGCSMGSDTSCCTASGSRGVRARCTSAWRSQLGEGHASYGVLQPCTRSPACMDGRRPAATT